MNIQNKPYFIPIILFSLSLCCVISYQLIGSLVDENGILQEPFALIPIGYLFFFAGIISGLIAIIKVILKRIKKNLSK